MRKHDWIFSVRLWLDPEKRNMKRVAVVGPARPSTVETALHLAGVPEDLRAEIRTIEKVRKFIEGTLDPESNGYYVLSPTNSTSEWVICIASIHEVIR